jgi:hypothetical protein
MTNKPNQPRVRKSPARAANTSEAKAAFDEVLPEIEGMPADTVLQVNLDIPRAVSVVLGAEPHIRAFEAQIHEQLPKHDLAAIQRLRIYALAALYAHLQAQPAPRRADLSELALRANALKQSLLIAAAALAHAGLIDGDKLAEIREGSGQIDLAADLVALSALFDASWDNIATKTAIARDAVDAASALGTELMVAVGARDNAASRTTPESLEQRKRAFTLLVRSYDSARQALTYLRWDQDDVDFTIPSLYAKTRRHTPEDPETPTDEPAAPAGMPKPDGAVQLSDANGGG